MNWIAMICYIKYKNLELLKLLNNELTKFITFQIIQIHCLVLYSFSIFLNIFIFTNFNSSSLEH